MSKSKTDNHNPQAKLDLRRHFLAKYHAAPFTVFDACQGSGVLWRTLSTEFSVLRYWGCDFKPKAGRMKIDSARVLEQPGWDDDVIDVDTYGEPWRHWLGILNHMPQAATVFMTIGNAGGMGGGSKLTMKAIGCESLSIPNTITLKLQRLAFDYLIGLAKPKLITIVEAIEVMNSGGNARYIGLRLERNARGMIR